MHNNELGAAARVCCIEIPLSTSGAHLASLQGSSKMTGVRPPLTLNRVDTCYSTSDGSLSLLQKDIYHHGSSAVGGSGLLNTFSKASFGLVT